MENTIDTAEMESNVSEPHIGQLIKREIGRQGRSVAWLAQKMQCSRQNVYRLLERDWIHTDTLLKICDILDRDFFGWYSSYWKAHRQVGLESDVVKKNDTK